MFGKGSKIYGIVNSKCPRCHEGDMFPNKNPYNLSRLTEINDRCSVCNQNFNPEPNYYYGAMYVSYGYTVALFVASYILGSVIIGLGMWETIALLVTLLIILAPYLFRLSRVTWLHINVHYRKDAVKKKTD